MRHFWMVNLAIMSILCNQIVFLYYHTLIVKAQLILKIQSEGFHMSSLHNLLKHILWAQKIFYPEEYTLSQIFKKSGDMQMLPLP